MSLSDVPDDVLTGVIRPWLLEKARLIKTSLGKEALEDLANDYEDFKQANASGLTNVEHFINVVLQFFPAWRAPTGQAELASIFKAVDADSSGDLDTDEYFAALAHISSYYFCSRGGCQKLLDPIRAGGFVCGQCPEGYTMCDEVRYKAPVIPSIQPAQTKLQLGQGPSKTGSISGHYRGMNESPRGHQNLFI